MNYNTSELSQAWGFEGWPWTRVFSCLSFRWVLTLNAVYCIYLFMCGDVCVHRRAMLHVWESDDNLLESVHSCLHVGPRNLTLMMFGRKHLHQPSLLTHAITVVFGFCYLLLAAGRDRNKMSVVEMKRVYSMRPFINMPLFDVRCINMEKCYYRLMV